MLINEPLNILAEYIVSVMQTSNEVEAKQLQTVDLSSWEEITDTNTDIKFRAPEKLNTNFDNIKNELIIKHPDYSINIKKETISFEKAYFSVYDDVDHPNHKAYQYDLFNNGAYTVKNIYLKINDNEYLYIVYNTKLKKESEVIGIIDSIKG